LPAKLKTPLGDPRVAPRFLPAQNRTPLGDGLLGTRFDEERSETR